MHVKIIDKLTQRKKRDIGLIQIILFSNDKRHWFSICFMLHMKRAGKVLIRTLYK